MSVNVIKNEGEEGRAKYLVRESMDDASMSNALVIFPWFLVLSTSSSYNF